MRRANRLAAQLPVPVVRIMAQRFVSAVKGSASQQFAESLHELEELAIMPRLKLKTLKHRGKEEPEGNTSKFLSIFIASNFHSGDPSSFGISGVVFSISGPYIEISG
jgi:hypothetical protein